MVAADSEPFYVEIANNVANLRHPPSVHNPQPDRRDHQCVEDRSVKRSLEVVGNPVEDP